MDKSIKISEKLHKDLMEYKEIYGVDAKKSLEMAWNKEYTITATKGGTVCQEHKNCSFYITGELDEQSRPIGDGQQFLTDLVEIMIKNNIKELKFK